MTFREVQDAMGGPSLTAADYEEVLADHRRLVRMLDAILNGVDGMAKQASLCDLLGQVEALVRQRNDLRDYLKGISRQTAAMVEANS
jgi:hypothetical protein